MNILWDYSPNTYFNLEETVIGVSEVDYVINELHLATKIIVSYDQAVNLYKRSGSVQGLDVKPRHTCEAYSIVFGNGCDYEFPYD